MNKNLAATTKKMHFLSIHIVLWLFHFYIALTNAQNIITNCTNTNHSTSNAYHQNLNLALISLAANASRTGYYVTTTGRAPDTVYGLVQCRGYVTNTDCQNCVDAQVSRIKLQCSNQKAVYIFNENCFIQFSDWNFFSTPDIDPRLYMQNPRNSTWPVLFNTQLGNLLRDLSSNAAANTNNNRLAFGNITYMDLANIYAMVQCVRDIADNECLVCLQNIISYIPQLLDKKMGGRIFSLSCNFRYEIYSFFLFSSSPSPSPLLKPNSTQDLTTHKGKTSKTVVLVAIVAGVTLTATLILLSAYFICRKGRVKRPADENEIAEESNDNLDSLSIGVNTLRLATSNFSEANKLGEGGFGPVYKGKLSDGRDIAVKRLSRSSAQGLEELKTEVMLVAKLLHRNLVRLIGFCLEEEEKLLVYEYMSNGSLDKTLFDQNRRFSLEWERRYKIIIGIARGLLYLHEDSQLRIVHRDLKASNILLDENMNPKISDFGLARLFSGSQTQANTDRIAGTYGYMAPEYAKNGQFSTKSDVYSFGILVLEIVTGQKNSRFHNLRNLQSYAWEHWIKGTALDLVDPTMGDQWPKYEVLKCIHIGLLCVQEGVVDRPSMSEIVMMLSGYSMNTPSPLQPAFFISKGSHGSNSEPLHQFHSFKLERPQQSVNEVSITDLYPR